MSNEPLRLTLIIDAPQQAIDRVIQKHSVVQQLLNNGWLHLWRYGQTEMQCYTSGAWSPVPWRISELHDKVGRAHRRHTDPLGRLGIPGAFRVDLPRLARGKPGFERPQTRIHGGLIGFAFHHEPWGAAFDQHEVHLAAIVNPKIALLNVQPLGVLPEMHPLEQV